MKIEVFAVLKDYFKKEFEIADKLDTIADLKQYLITLNPSSVEVLSRCRFAVADDFVVDNYKITGDDNIMIIPPSSGG
ncbi:MoaD/ThiS family protein [Arcticibacter eurypsychrophilus]|uniref:MoaD/ThiS family protein n=1 Tax=Arcticibacter eurypsychrophilus TaxID=1434752 RepID=UPI00084DCA6C|nr:MoaD/ThiS family protein [Arcticibacter eurypsychrophilus]